MCFYSIHFKFVRDRWAGVFRGVRQAAVSYLRLVPPQASIPTETGTDSEAKTMLQVLILPDLEVLFSRKGFQKGGLQLPAMIEADTRVLTADGASSCPAHGAVVISGFASMCLYIHAAFVAKDQKAIVRRFQDSRSRP